jgi:hypothetical protein
MVVTAYLSVFCLGLVAGWIIAVAISGPRVVFQPRRSLLTLLLAVPSGPIAALVSSSPFAIYGIGLAIGFFAKVILDGAGPRKPPRAKTVQPLTKKIRKGMDHTGRKAA